MTAACSSDVSFATTLMVTGVISCPANPVLMGSGHPSDLGFGVEAHYHRCPECFHVWRHIRPIDAKGVGWTVEKAIKLMTAQEADTGHSKYKVAHSCPSCRKDPVFGWARGPIAPELMDYNYFPMSCA